jgi:hypothetical protein
MHLRPPLPSPALYALQDPPRLRVARADRDKRPFQRCVRQDLVCAWSQVASHDRLRSDFAFDVEKWASNISEKWEDAGAHWGVTVRLSETACPVCLMPLASEVLPADGLAARRLVVMPCGHCYHEVCLEELECVACFVHLDARRLPDSAAISAQEL